MPDIMQDPAYLAYYRAMGFEDANTRDEAQLAQTKAQAQIDLYRPEIAYQGEIDRRGIGEAHEDRGTFRSGMHLRDAAEQEHAQALATGQLDLEGADSLAEIQRQQQIKLAASQRKLGDQGLLADSRQYLEEGLAPYRT